MKRYLTSSMLLLFICVQPIASLSANEGGPAHIGDELVHIGEIELEKGNVDGAIHEFSKALMAQPSNKEAQRYLRELGYLENIYASETAFMPYYSDVMSRMDVISRHMDYVESQMAEAEAYYAQAQPETCKGYLEGADERAGIITLCDGTKRFIRRPWHTGNFLGQEEWNGREGAPKKNQQDYHQKTQIYSQNTRSRVDADRLVSVKRSMPLRQKMVMPRMETYQSDGYRAQQPMMASSAPISYPTYDPSDYMDQETAQMILMIEDQTESLAQLSEAPTPKRMNSLHSSSPEQKVQRTAMETPSYQGEMSDSQLVQDVMHSYKVIEQNEYAEFLKDHYLTSQQMVANRGDIIEEQEMYLAMLQEELDEARETIQELLYQQEELINKTSYQVRQMDMEENLQ